MFLGHCQTIWHAKLYFVVCTATKYPVIITQSNLKYAQNQQKSTFDISTRL